MSTLIFGSLPLRVQSRPVQYHANVYAVVAVYLLGVVLGLVLADAPWAVRLGLAALWPLAILACIVTSALLLAASFVLFPVWGLAVLAVTVAAWFWL